MKDPWKIRYESNFMVTPLLIKGTEIFSGRIMISHEKHLTQQVLVQKAIIILLASGARLQLAWS